MKTVMDAMAECLAGMTNDDVSPAARRKIEACLTAALSASPAGAVKPLEWVDRGEIVEDRFKASSVVGDYYVRREKSGLFSWRLPALRGSVVVGDAEAAKSSAFADYSARIMSAIEPAGVGVEDVGDPEAWLFHEPPPQTNFPGNAHVLFGLEAQGHIPAVEAALAEGVDWQEIGLRIGWCGETAKQYYERHLARAALKGDEQ